MTSVAKLLQRFLLTMPLDAAKKARTLQMKCCSVGDNPAQSVVLAVRSISSAVQKDASAFFYICQISLCWIGKISKWWGFCLRRGSGARWPSISAMLCFKITEHGDGGFFAFLVVDGCFVLVQKPSQWSPLSWMKFVILQKAWYEMTCSSGMMTMVVLMVMLLWWWSKYVVIWLWMWDVNQTPNLPLIFYIFLLLYNNYF